METCRPHGRTGSTTGTNVKKESSDFHGNTISNGRYRIGSSADEEQRTGETLEEYLERVETLNGNNCHSSSRSTFRSGSEMTSDSDFIEERRNSAQSDTDVFFPSTEPEIDEQKRILDQKRRELPPSHRSWKRVADYVNGLPIIPEPPIQGEVQNKNIGQAKRQRIWSEVYDRRRDFTQSGSLSFAEGMTSQKHITSTSSSNLSMLSSLSSLSGSLAWFESGDDADKTLLPLPEKQSSHPLTQQRQHSTQPTFPAEQNQEAISMKYGWNENNRTLHAVKLPLKPKGLVKEKAFHGSSSVSPSQDGRSSPTEGSLQMQDKLPIPNKDKPLHRRMTNSDLIALATQHRQQQHTTHRRRQNLLQMGMSNVSDSSDTDTSGHSYSSIDDLLIARHDPEEILLNLGFGGSPDKDAVDRIPSRFLQTQSQAKGISTDHYLYQMDELERGCGFSLVGGLRSLGPALRRSSRMSTSPIIGREPTPPNVNSTPVNVIVEPQHEQKETQQNKPPRKEPCKELPDDDLNHNVETVQTQKEVKYEMGHKIKGHHKLVEQSNVDDIELTPIGESSPVGHKTVHGKSQRTEVTSVSTAPSTGQEKENMNVLKNQRNNLPCRLGSKIQSGCSNLGRRPQREVDIEPNEKCSVMKEINQEKGLALQPRIAQLSNTHPGTVTGQGLHSREDSFEFEELSSEERLEDNTGMNHTAEASLNNQGNLIRSDSTQSDSSGFADENTGSNETESPKSTSGNSTITSDSKITQTSFDADIEPLDSSQFQRLHYNSVATSDKNAELTISQESMQSLPSVTSLDDSPFDDAIVVTELLKSDTQRTRYRTYPAAQDRRVEESGPKTVVEILSSLHTTSKELDKESNQGPSESTRRKHPKLMKMKSVDPEGYGFKRNAESKGVQTQVESSLKVSHKQIYEVLHEVDEELLSQDGLTDDGHGTKEGRPVQSVTKFSIPDEQCKEHVTEESNAALETNVEDVCEGSDAAPIESNVIPSYRSHEACQRLSITTSHSTESVSVKSKHSDYEHQVSCDEVKLNPAIPDVSDSNNVQLSSRVSNKFLSENLSTCIKDDISNDELSCNNGNIGDGERSGRRVEQTLSEINQCEFSSQTSSTVTDDADVSFIKCQWDKKVPFSAYSSSEFDVEHCDVPRDVDFSENSILDQQEVEEKENLVVDVETLITVRHVETSGICVTASNECGHNNADSGETEQSVTTQDTALNDATLPAGSIEVSSALPGSLPDTEKLSSTAQTTASIDVSSVQVALSSSRSAIDEVQPSEVTECASDIPIDPEQLLKEVASQPLLDNVIDTRIEIINKEEHSKAREELKALLASQDHPLLSSSVPLKSANHSEAVEDLKLLQRALGRYHQDLEELELWSSKLFQDVGFALSPEERSDLHSLSKVRHKIKDEIQSLQTNLMEKFQAVISMDMECEKESLWSPSLSHVMCQMVDLLKEQTSLRTFLDDLQALENSSSPTPSWSGQSSKPRNRLVDATFGGSVDDDGNQSEGETDEATSDLSYPGTMSQGELIEELHKAQSALKKMKFQAKQDVVMAVREVRQSILSEVRREIHMESQLLQVQMQAKDMEIENLRSMVRELKETSMTMSGFETVFHQMARDKES
ncbi:uncharacterized protein LOC121427793 isoform X2 [Lytechinus variegatus]|uniref:uncharacterized protein LOC121427793 isoform X2 n=1 Tax=Lytechinus variegatus TaxID=7654 RepID=UPI001BB17A55|nr:uncharacterized protein LOC121427793 isoform X2 [Lytechinus variegatus]